MTNGSPPPGFNPRSRNRLFPHAADDERLLLELKAAGKSNAVIANALRRTAAAIEQRLHVIMERERAK
jgi:DNA-binding NarL/FixJ family response regulator